MTLNLEHRRGLDEHFAPPLFPAEYTELRWYAVLTRARHEKHVAEQLGRRAVNSYVPLYESVRRWKDRRKLVLLPLFPGYVFVRIALKDQRQVLEIPSVARFVGFNGKPAALDSAEIETLRGGLAEKLRGEPYPYLTAGRQVRIRSGAFRGLEGILIRKKGTWRVVVSIHLIQRSVLLDVDAASLEVR